jgi:hypothetical protein
VGGDDEYPVQVGSLALRAEHHVVQNRLVQRHGDVVLGFEGYGALEILFLHVRKVQEPNDHPLARDAEDDGLALEGVRGPELFYLSGEEVGIGDLTLAYHPRR